MLQPSIDETRQNMDLSKCSRRCVVEDGPNRSGGYREDCNARGAPHRMLAKAWRRGWGSGRHSAFAACVWWVGNYWT